MGSGIGDHFKDSPEISGRLKLYRSDASNLDKDIFPDASFDFICAGGLDENAFYSSSDAASVLKKIALEEERLLRPKGVVYHVLAQAKDFHAETLKSGQLVPLISNHYALLQRSGTFVDASLIAQSILDIVEHEDMPSDAFTLDGLFDYFEKSHPDVLQRGRTREEKMVLLCLSLKNYHYRFEIFRALETKGRKFGPQRIEELNKLKYEDMFKRLDSLEDKFMTGYRAFAVAQGFRRDFEKFLESKQTASGFPMTKRFFELSQQPAARIFAGEWERLYVQELSMMTAKELSNEWDRLFRTHQGNQDKIYGASVNMFDGDTCQHIHPYKFTQYDELLLDGGISEDRHRNAIVYSIALTDIYLEWVRRHWDERTSVETKPDWSKNKIGLDFIENEQSPFEPSVIDIPNKPFKERPSYKVLTHLSDQAAVKIIGGRIQETFMAHVGRSVEKARAATSGAKETELVEASL